MNRDQYGFTLLEVMVALAILALVLGAIISAGGSSANHLGMLREKTLASWVAQNKINELLLAPEWPEAGSKNGASELAGWEWYWETRISKTSDPDLRRLEVAVRTRQDAAPVIELIAFKGRLRDDVGADAAPNDAAPNDAAPNDATRPAVRKNPDGSKR